MQLNGQGNRINKKIENPHKWYGTTVQYIIRREEYMGYAVSFKTTKKSFKEKKRYANDRKKWVFFENAHDPIVTKEQEELKKKSIS